MRNRIAYVVLLAVLSGCSSEFNRPDTSGIDIEVRVDPIYKKVFGGGDIHSKVIELSKGYGDMFSDYCGRELRIGRPGDEDFEENFKRFVEYKENKEVIAACDSVYDSLGSLDDELTEALKCFKYYFSDVVTPEVYCHFSGFNSKILIDSTYVSFSIEHYLGSGCRFYQWLEVPQYARRSKEAYNIVPDVLKALIYAHYPDESESEDVLSAMLYQGKVLYCVKCCLPELELSRLLGYSEEELKWCEEAEAEMWGFLAEQRLLYSTNLIDRRKLVNEAPFTTYFGQSSPGRAVLYCAFNIIRSYMHHHPEETPESLLKCREAQRILMEAHYRP